MSSDKQKMNIKWLLFAHKIYTVSMQSLEDYDTN